MSRTDKFHINQQLRTTFANSGRVAGMGIAYDRYDDESGTPRYDPGAVRVKLPSDNLTPEERTAMNGKVIVRKAKKEAQKNGA